jgi:hypothetical protein
MERNVGDTDSQVRLALGALSGLVSLAILAQSLNVINEVVALPEILSPVLGVFALALLATSFTRKCPVCSAAGVDTTQ